MRNLALVWMIVSLLALLTACGSDHSPAGSGERVSSGQLSVVATTGMIGDLATRLVGDLGAVETLMGPGIDPHLFKASEGDVRKLAGADLILYNGLHLEGKMGDILVKMARDRSVVAVSDSVPEADRNEPPAFLGQYDPHIWFDVSLWIHTIDTSADALVALRLNGEADIRERADAFRAELEALDGWALERIKEIPSERRVLVTAHDAFGYFGERYGLEVIGIQGISTATEAGLQDIDRIVDRVVEGKLPAIFVESSVPRQTIEAVQAACQARGHQVAIGGELFSDAMGPAGTPEGTYPGMVRHNVNTIVEALK